MSLDSQTSLELMQNVTSMFAARILSTKHVVEEIDPKLTTPFKSSESAVSFISL